VPRTKLPEPIIVGYVAGAVDGVEEIIGEPPVPGSYKLPASIEKWRNDPELGGKAAAKAIAEAAFCKVTGQLLSIFAIDPLKGLIFDSRQLGDSPESANLSPAVAFATWLLGERPGAFREYPSRLGSTENAVAFYGLDVKEFVRVLGIECQLNGYDVPIGLWYQNEDCFDPYDMVVESERRNLLPLSALLACVGIKHSEDWSPHRDPEEDARLAVELIHCFGLLPRYDEEKLYGIVQDNVSPFDEIEPVEEEAVAEDVVPGTAEEEYSDADDVEADYVEEEEEDVSPPPPPPVARRRSQSK